MSEELLRDIMSTRLELDDIISAHKFAESREEKRHLKTNYAKLLNTYIVKQNNYKIYLRDVENERKNNPLYN